MRALALILAPLAIFCLACSSECETDEATCSADGLILTTCVDGRLTKVPCMREHGQLCESGRCVDPWRYGSPAWSVCAEEPRATPESLAEKAARYEEIARRLHVHPRTKLMQGVQLRDGTVEDSATFDDVERWLSGENDGLWSALYLASQAYRYAATGSEEALEMVRLLLEGEVERMEVTGVPGLFTRQYIPPGVPGLACPTDDAAYTTDSNKDDNRWVQIRDDGCVWVVDLATGEWTQTDHCDLDQFAGYCWIDNVSKDEYAGHMFALGMVYRLVDSEDVRTTVRQLLRQVVAHLRSNGLAFRDWDGRLTEHGRHHPLSFEAFPGFNAAMSLAYFQMAIEATGDAGLREEHERCMLMKDGPVDCYETGRSELLPFSSLLGDHGLYIGPEGCLGNYNNHSMHMLSMHGLINYTRDPERRERYQGVFDTALARAEEPRAVLKQNNAFFNFIWAAGKRLGPGSDGPALEAVRNGLCMLRQFPASQADVQVKRDPALVEPYCIDRFGRDTGGIALEVADRCVQNFLWWKDPYDIRDCSARPRVIEVPTDYLLAYWMGRYYGFITEDL